MWANETSTNWYEVEPDVGDPETGEFWAAQGDLDTTHPAYARRDGRAVVYRSAGGDPKWYAATDDDGDTFDALEDAREFADSYIGDWSPDPIYPVCEEEDHEDAYDDD